MTTNSQSVKEAITALEQETESKIEAVHEYVKQACDSFRTEGMIYLDQLPHEARQLTVEEFYSKYGESIEAYFGQQRENKLEQLDEIIENPTAKRENRSDDLILDDNESFIDLELPVEEADLREGAPEMGPIFIRLERKDRSNISIKLDPNKTVPELGKYMLIAPDNILWQLEDQTHRHRVWEQIEDIRSQLELFQNRLLEK
ncbi:hypothetical protein RMATCC62417_04538 [Rhizopus microsporus]|nr:hypothetical protein RMATCC62417_04538 [Rhizopus microsporus]